MTRRVLFIMATGRKLLNDENRNKERGNCCVFVCVCVSLLITVAASHSLKLNFGHCNGKIIIIHQITLFFMCIIFLEINTFHSHIENT